MRWVTWFLVGVLLALALVPLARGDERPEAPKPTTFVGPGFMLDLTRWAPFYVEQGVYFCIMENGKMTCATVQPGTVLLIPRGDSPVDSTAGF